MTAPYIVNGLILRLQGGKFWLGPRTIDDEEAFAYVVWITLNELPVKTCAVQVAENKWQVIKLQRPPEIVCEAETLLEVCLEYSGASREMHERARAGR